MKNKNIKAVVYALAAASFYALNVPLSKILLQNIGPVFMAVLLYLGAGIGMGMIYFFHKNYDKPKLSKKDLPYVIGMIVLDSIAPILLMTGINLGTSSNASLIGNFEIVATALFSMLLFHEKISRVLCFAISLITLSSVIISYDGNEIWIFSKGSLFVAAATLCWGLENNCTRNIADKNTYQIVTIKGIFSSLCSLSIAVIIHEKVPDSIYFFPALTLGFVSYGLSIFTYIKAQETLGAAKTSAYYAIAPFIAAIFSLIILNEPLSLNYSVAFFIMVIGTSLIIYDTLKQSHSHKHSHTFTHVHGGLIHSHTITHTHEHNHFYDINRHGHKHKLNQLEMEL